MHACSGTSAASDSLWPHGQKPAMLLCPWDFPGKNTTVGCYAPLQEMFLTKGLNLCLLSPMHCRRVPYCWVTGEIPNVVIHSSKQRKYNIKSDPECKLWTLGDYDISVHLSLAKKKIPLWWVILIMEYALHVWGQGLYGKFLYCPPNLVLNLKQIKKNWTLQLSSLKT